MVCYCRTRLCVCMYPRGPSCQRTNERTQREPKGLGPTYWDAYSSASETFHTPRPTQNTNKYYYTYPINTNQPDGRTSTSEYHSLHTECGRQQPNILTGHAVRCERRQRAAQHSHRPRSEVRTLATGRFCDFATPKNVQKIQKI